MVGDARYKKTFRLQTCVQFDRKERLTGFKMFTCVTRITYDVGCA